MVGSESDADNGGATDIRYESLFDKNKEDGLRREEQRGWRAQGLLLLVLGHYQIITIVVREMEGSSLCVSTGPGTRVCERASSLSETSWRLRSPAGAALSLATQASMPDSLGNQGWNPSSLSGNGTSRPAALGAQQTPLPALDSPCQLLAHPTQCICLPTSARPLGVGPTQIRVRPSGLLPGRGNVGETMHDA